MRISRTGPARRAGSGAHAGRTGGGQDARAVEPSGGRVTAARGPWTVARGPWAVVCAVVTVVLGPAAVTASALDQANAAPRHHTTRADDARAYVPVDRTRLAAVPRSRTGTS
ncbi:hypothetical protein ACFWJM_35695 [Streptomyces sp. NPDC127077]|uniref:hypothetical protein n=1 Tax=Streptomyces sp. NPDC127077 TaxID=3347131 RepID=UPI003646570A